MIPSPSEPHYEPAASGETKRVQRYLPNPAFHITAQGADPDVADLGWCIRRCWRVIYYSNRHDAGLPLWEGAAAFERLMAEVLTQLSGGFEPIAPVRVPEEAQPEDQLLDWRSERFKQPSCRIFRTPRFDRPGWDQ
jgi:hypothetical protein